MKVIKMATVGASAQELQIELDTQRKLDHPNICKIYESYMDEEHGEMAIIMEMCTGGGGGMRAQRAIHGHRPPRARCLRLCRPLLSSHMLLV